MGVRARAPFAPRIVRDRAARRPISRAKNLHDELVTLLEKPRYVGGLRTGSVRELVLMLLKSLRC
jgi:hypothetical protein